MAGTGVRIEIVVFDGFDEIDVFGPFEILAAAGFDVALVHGERAGEVRSMRGLRLVIEDVLAEPHGVIIPGGGWLNRAAAGAWAEVERGTLTRRLVEVAPTTRWMASVCSGGMLLASAGLLHDRYATTNRSCYDELRPLVREVVDERVVDDGDRISGGALFSGVDLALWLTERELGRDVADRVATGVEYQRVGRVWHAPR